MQERPNRDILYDEFLEEAINLSPADREERQVELTLPQQDDFFTEVDLNENLRHERDGVHGHQNGGRRGGRRQQDSFSAPAPAPVEPRGGRQTGGTAPALGLLNNPPNENGDYNFNFSTDDGARREEQGRVGSVQGSYSFISPEGEQFSVSYTADETGFHPSGLPPMPAHVQRTLDHLAKVNGK
ncbi:larval cuticle protein LCP-22 [Eurytemora carolleeae]|uniref:larval cuticle protein LCP-22 n=1 Tax=Eurytemora carolleeae TaxID=1294199 RepID=UPI000C78FFDB|nr:larval cuticle protein LCP-22 [Eurytemora carolleeae]|eukprot:XP_023335297.1 larval cuticle protein LCP-22-like [Eurytemora affinis]